MDNDKRQRRIKRLKKEIKIVLLFLIIFPWLIVTVIAVKNKKLSKENAAKEELLNQYLEQMEMLSSSYETAVKTEEPQVVMLQGPKYNVEEMTKEEIEALSLSDEELYDGYRKVYLTFDDGPSSNTEAILDILKQYDVKATFFVIRREGREYEELYRRIVEEGHSLGMHSCTHVYSELYKDEDSFLEDTKRIRDFLYLVTGVESNIYRFPGGSSNKVSSVDMHKFAGLLESEGIEYYDWNVSSGDATSPILSKSRIVSNATGNLEYFSEAMILFHDTASKVSTVEALPEIIEIIQSMDDTVMLPITKETNPIHHISVDK